MDDLHDAIVVLDDTQAPERREGDGLSFIGNRSLIQQAIRDGWIKSLQRMDELVQDAIDDVRSYEQGHGVFDPIELSKLKQALARTGATAAAVYTKSVQVAEEKSDPEDATDEDLKSRMSKVIDAVRLHRANGDAGVVSEPVVNDRPALPATADGG